MRAVAAARDRPPIGMLMTRCFGFFVLWLALIGTAPLDMMIGLLAVGAAAFASARLWPSKDRLSLLELIRFVLRFLPQALVAGLEVARQAMAPRITMKPGLVGYRTTVPPGLARGAMCAVMSLQPGKLPVSRQASGDILIHCLDADAPVIVELAADEAAFLRILSGGRGLG